MIYLHELHFSCWVFLHALKDCPLKVEVLYALYTACKRTYVLLYKYMYTYTCRNRPIVFP